MKPKMYSYKNINIHYTDEGSGLAVVFLHGFLESKTMWNVFATQLRAKYRIITIDLLGHGLSENLGYIHTMEEQAAMVFALLEFLKCQKVVLVGHSMGGYVALSFAKAYPNFVKGMVLQNSTAKPDSEERQLNRDRAINAVKQNHRNFISMSIANLFSENNQIKLVDTIQLVKNEAYKTPLQGIIAALEGMKIRPDVTALLKEATFPIVLVLGKKDAVLDFETTKQQIEATNVKLVAFEEGHMSHLENEAELLVVLQDFLGKLN
jgi:pimeloyl-ACP methyl ester carboxylesterase